MGRDDAGLPVYEQAQGEAVVADRDRFASEAAPPPEQQAGRRRPRSTAGRNLLKAHEEAVALIEGVPFTNNQAARDLTESERLLSH